MEDNGVEADPIEEAQAEGQLVELVENGTSDLDDGEFCRVRGICRGGEDTEVALYFTFCADRIKQTGDGILHM